MGGREGQQNKNSQHVVVADTSFGFRSRSREVERTTVARCAMLCARPDLVDLVEPLLRRLPSRCRGGCRGDVADSPRVHLRGPRRGGSDLDWWGRPRCFPFATPYLAACLLLGRCRIVQSKLSFVGCFLSVLASGAPLLSSLVGPSSALPPAPLHQHRSKTREFL